MHKLSAINRYVIELLKQFQIIWLHDLFKYEGDLDELVNFLSLENFMRTLPLTLVISNSWVPSSFVYADKTTNVTVVYNKVMMAISKALCREIQLVHHTDPTGVQIWVAQKRNNADGVIVKIVPVTNQIVPQTSKSRPLKKNNIAEVKSVIGDTPPVHIYLEDSGLLGGKWGKTCAPLPKVARNLSFFIGALMALAICTTTFMLIKTLRRPRLWVPNNFFRISKLPSLEVAFLGGPCSRWLVCPNNRKTS